jgi:hypothetical protein
MFESREICVTLHVEETCEITERKSILLFLIQCFVFPLKFPTALFSGPVTSSTRELPVLLFKG